MSSWGRAYTRACTGRRATRRWRDCSSRLARRYTSRISAWTDQDQQWTLAYRARADGERRHAGSRAASLPHPRAAGGPVLGRSVRRLRGRPDFVFFEDCGYAPRRGRISVLEIGPRNPSAAVPVLERDYHLSYPFLFTWGGAHFMIPESSANSSVRVYRHALPVRVDAGNDAVRGSRIWSTVTLQ